MYQQEAPLTVSTVSECSPEMQDLCILGPPVIDPYWNNWQKHEANPQRQSQPNRWMGLGFWIPLPGVKPRSMSLLLCDFEQIPSLSFYFLTYNMEMMIIVGTSSLDCANLLPQQKKEKIRVAIGFPTSKTQWHNENKTKVKNQGESEQPDVETDRAPSTQKHFYFRSTAHLELTKELRS